MPRKKVATSVSVTKKVTVYMNRTYTNLPVPPSMSNRGMHLTMTLRALL